MNKQRFVETGSNTFYGEYLYDQIVSQDHFLRELKSILDREYFTRRLIKLYKDEGLVGRRHSIQPCF